MKKRGLAAALAMLTMATTGTAFAATNYWIPVYYNNEGYNSTPVKKVIPADHAYVKALGSNHNELPTNYIVLITTLIISKKPGNTGISRDIRTEFTTDLLLSD